MLLQRKKSVSKKRVKVYQYTALKLHVFQIPRSPSVYAYFSSSPSGLPIDTVQWDLSNLPVRTSSVDIIVTDMPFGKRYCGISEAYGTVVIFVNRYFMVLLNTECRLFLSKNLSDGVATSNSVTLMESLMKSAKVKTYLPSKLNK